MYLRTGGESGMFNPAGVSPCHTDLCKVQFVKIRPIKYCIRVRVRATLQNDYCSLNDFVPCCKERFLYMCIENKIN